MQLENAIVIRIKTSGFDLDKIAHSGHCFRWVEIGPSKYLVIDGRRQALLEKIEPGNGGGPFGVYRAFPGPDVLRNATERLKSLGLGYRARYVSNIARLVLEGEICLDYLNTADYTEARTYLKSIDGIGERIASLICLYGLGMKEAFPADANFKKIVARKYGGRFPVELYGTNRGVAWLYVTTADRMERGRGK